MIRNVKQVLVYVLVIAALAGGVLYLLNYLNELRIDRPKTKVFFGTATGLENGIISVTGFPDAKGANESDVVKIRVVIGPETKIIKESGEYKLRVTPGSDKPASRDDVARDRQTVDIGQLKQDIDSKTVSVKVVADHNVYGQNKFTAKEIYYNTDNHFYNAAADTLNQNQPAPENSLQTSIFVGTLEKVNNQSVMVKGLPIGSGIDRSEFKSGQLASVNVISTTNIFKINKFGKQSKVDFQQLKTDAAGPPLLIRVVATENVYHKDVFMAAEIFYSDEP